jgi:hypothetical protein
VIVLGIAAFVIYRIAMAFIAIFRLARDTRMLRALPWPYIVRLPRRNFWIATATASLLVGAVAVLGASVLPGPYHGRFAAVGLIALWLGLVSSWVHLFSQAFGARRS